MRESPHNTLVLPGRNNRAGKDGESELGFVQDSSAISHHVTVPRPAAPDPSAVLSQTPHRATRFAATDLTAAFSSIPTGEESQLLFAFAWKRRQLTWTRLPQGFTGSPTTFSRILKED